jgi:uncharacterized membrane protein YbaN (DUF454 family)
MIKKVLKIIIGILSATLALLGFLIPIIPGWPFLLFAIFALTPKHGQKIKDWIQKKRNKEKKPLN